jgi:hypothetical protein
MVFNATFNNISVISCWSVLLVEEIGGPGENLQINVFLSFNINKVESNLWDRHGRDRMVVEFTTAYASSAYLH